MPATAVDVPDSHQDLLHAHQAVALCTINADGSPQCTAVWSMVGDDGLIRVSFPTSGQKYRNLTRSPVASLLYVDPSNPFRTLEIRAAVELHPDDEARTSTRALITSYGVDPATFGETVQRERMIATFRPTHVVTLR